MDSTTQNNKDQKNVSIEEETKVNSQVYKDDVDTLAIVFTFLPARQAGVASMVSRRFQIAFGLSEVIQTNEVKADIRWSKYSCGQLEPELLFTDDNYNIRDSKLCTPLLVRSGNVSVASNYGHWLSQPANDASCIQIHSTTDEAIKTFNVDESLGVIYLAYLTNNNDLITYHRREVRHDLRRTTSGTIQYWKQMDQSKFEKGPCISDIEDDVTSISTTHDNNVYFRISTTHHDNVNFRSVGYVMLWKPSIEGSITYKSTTIVEETSSSCTQSVCWNDLLIFDAYDGIDYFLQLWSTKDNEKLQSFGKYSGLGFVLDLSVKQKHGKTFLFASYNDGVFCIFSLNDGTLLRRMHLATNQTIPRMVFSPSTNQLALVSESVDEDRIHILKIDINANTKTALCTSRKVINLTEGFNGLNIGIKDIYFSPDGRLLTNTQQVETSRSTCDIYMW